MIADKARAKTVLIICHAFPPVGGMAVQRPLKFARYLGGFGWKVTVLTSADVYAATMDPSLLQEVPADVTVVRVSDPVSKWVGKAISKTTTSGGPTHRPTRLPWFKRMVRSTLKKLKQALFVPDEHVVWALFAAREGIKLAKELGVDCVYTTSGPNSTHVAGLLIHWLTRTKWVADFRDPWTDNFHFSHRGFRRRLEGWMERQVFHGASAVITVTDGFKALFDRKYPHVRKNIRVIRNGVDPSDFPSESPYPKSDRFTLLYAGILYPARSPAVFFQALSRLLRYGYVRRDEIRVQFAGVFDYPGYEDNRRLVEQLDLQEVVEVLGYLPRKEVLARMMSADALLLFGDRPSSARDYVPGKVYEYLYAGRPILALLPDCEAADIIRSANGGIVVDPYKPEAVAEALRSLMSWRSEDGQDAQRPGTVEMYTRQKQTQQLAALMDRLVQTGAAQSQGRRRGRLGQADSREGEHHERTVVVRD
ncbi:glycosyltransferase family 4 protein [Alicyclobacillus macrosporangiidus]|uniref:glycosyltransferase family 4 protein n=1 Tax=Alicyclobacillus macrosporangiidus TaxID=392015 RepID=UPI000B2C64F6|nr:glycosyltransferase family 4 protein [Alicyclobacillus macrosporangiidus]